MKVTHADRQKQEQTDMKVDKVISIVALDSNIHNEYLFLKNHQYYCTIIEMANRKI